MATTSAATVFTGLTGGRGDNSGGAAILDQYQDFQPIMNEIYKSRQAELVRQRQDQKAADAKWNAMMKDFDPEAVALQDQEELMGEMSAYNDELYKLKSSGANPEDVYSPAGKKAREIEFRIKNLSKASKENQAFFNVVQSDIKKGDPNLDKKYAVDWLERYKSAKTIDEKARMRNEESPFRTRFNYPKVLERVKPSPRTEISQNGLQVDKTTELNEETYRNALRADMSTELGAADYELWKNAAGNEDKTPQDYEDFMVTMAQNTIKSLGSTTYKTQSKSSSGGSSGGIGGGKFVFTPKYGTSEDEIIITRSGTNDNLPPIMVNDKTFQAKSLVMDKNGNVTGVKGEIVGGSSRPDNWNNMTLVEKMQFDLDNGSNKRTPVVYSIEEVGAEISNQLGNIDLNQLGKKYSKSSGGGNAKTSSDKSWIAKAMREKAANK